MFVVSAWLEPGAVPTLRARVRSTTDVEKAAENVRAAASLDEVIAQLREWWGALQDD